jgi:hypothetical protein
MSGLRDLLPVMSHAWDRLGIKISDLGLELEPLGGLLGLFHPDYDPFAPDPRKYFGDASDPTHGLFSENNGLPEELMDKLRPLEERTKQGDRWWVDEPRSLRATRQ